MTTATIWPFHLLDHSFQHHWDERKKEADTTLWKNQRDSFHPNWHKFHRSSWQVKQTENALSRSSTFKSLISAHNQNNVTQCDMSIEDKYDRYRQKKTRPECPLPAGLSEQSTFTKHLIVSHFCRVPVPSEAIFSN
jgi:hypothetical protein